MQRESRMLQKQNYNFESGTSLLEVILSITLVLLLVPFLYVQIADMNDSVKNIAVANKIVKMRNDIKNYILLHNADFDNNENHELDDNVLQEIAPGANRGFVRKKQGDVVGIEAFIEFNIDNSKYKAADIARYIGDDAAVVQSDHAAYSEYWAAALGGADAFVPGNLIYYVNYSFNSGDESNYLHKSSIGGFNVMERRLDMNNNKLKNVKEIHVGNLDVENGEIKSINDDVDISTANVIFHQEFNVGSNSNLSFSRLIGVSSFNICGDFKSIELGELSANELTVTSTVNVTDTLEIKSGLTCNSNSNFDVVFDNVVFTNKDLYLFDFVATTLQMSDKTPILLTQQYNSGSLNIGASEKVMINGHSHEEMLEQLAIPAYIITDSNNRTVTIYEKLGVQ